MVIIITNFRRVSPSSEAYHQLSEHINNFRESRIGTHHQLSNHDNNSEYHQRYHQHRYFPQFGLRCNSCDHCNFSDKSEQKMFTTEEMSTQSKRNCRLGISKFLITKSWIFRSRDQFFSIFFLQNFLKMGKLYHTQAGYCSNIAKVVFLDCPGGASVYSGVCHSFQFIDQYKSNEGHLHWIVYRNLLPYFLQV